MSGTVSHRAGNNVLLGGIAIVVIAVAGTLMYQRSKETTSDTELASDSKITLACNKCGESWEITFTEYQAQKKARKDKLDRLACKECGEKSAWQTSRGAALQGPGEDNPIPPDMVLDLNERKPTEEGDEQATSESSGAPEVQADESKEEGSDD